MLCFYCTCNNHLGQASIRQLSGVDISPQSHYLLRHLSTASTSTQQHNCHTLTMSQLPFSSYPPSSSAIPAMQTALNPDTPPLPPPKPGSHEASRGATPQTSTALPVASQASQEWYQAQPGNGRSAPPANIAHVNEPLPKPPTVEEGCLPDAVRDKS